MSTKGARQVKSHALGFLEDLTGGPLTLAEFLIAVRQADEWSQTEMARKLKVSRQNLCDIEKGRKIVSPERAARFAEILGYPKTQLVRLALQDQLERAGLDLTVQVAAA